MSATVPLPFVPNVLTWSDDDAHLAAGGIVFPLTLGTNGLAVIRTATGTVAWQLDGWGCADVLVAGPLLAACLTRGGTGTSTPFQSSLEVHDLASGTRTWQRADIALGGDSRVAADGAGRLLAVAAAQEYALVELATGQDIASIALKPVLTFRPAISPSGTQVAVAYDAGADGVGVAICDTATGTARLKVPISSAPLVAEFDETGATVTIAELAGIVTVLRANSGDLVRRSALADVRLPGQFTPQLVLSAGHLMALSPDGRIVLVAELAGNSLFAAATGARLGTVPAVNTIVSRAAFSPTARTAVVTAAMPPQPGAIDVMALSVPHPRVLWQQSLREAPAAAFSRTGRLAVARKTEVQPGAAVPAAAAGEVLLDVVTAGPLLTINAASGPEPGVSGVDVASAARLVVCACADKTARLFGLGDGQLRFAREHPGPLACAVFLSEGRSFATACTDGQVRLFDSASGEQSWVQQQAGPVNALAAAPDGSFVCTASTDRTVRLLDAATGRQHWQAAFPQGVTRVAVSPDGSFAVAACTDRTARLLRTADGSQAWQVQHDARVRDLAVSPDATLVATASQDGIVRVLAAATGAIARQVSHVQGATSVTFSADGQDVVSGSLDGAVLISAPADASAVPVLLMQAAAPVGQVRAGPGRSVAVVARDGLIRLLDLDLRADLARIYTSGIVNDIAIAPGLIASGADDGTLRVDPWPGS